MTNFKIVGLFIISLLALRGFSQNNKPVLLPNAEMHLNKIKRIACDNSGKYILTMSSDKTAKLWDASLGTLIKTYRIPIEVGRPGTIYSGDISPDGRLVALGGYTNSSNPQTLYILDAVSGEIIQYFHELPNVANDILFTKDGKYLFVAMPNYNGISIYETGTDSLLHFKKSLSGYPNAVYNIEYHEKDRILVTVCFDGKIRVYDQDFNLIKERGDLAGKQPISVAISPDGSKIAVGYNDTKRIEVLDAHTLGSLYFPSVPDPDDNVRFLNVIFSEDGKYLFGGHSGSTTRDSIPWAVIRRWKNAGKGKFRDFFASKGTIQDIRTLHNGDLIYCGSYPDFGRLSPEGKMAFYQEAELTGIEDGEPENFTINQDGNTVAFPPSDLPPKVFVVNEKKLTTRENWVEKNGDTSFPPCFESSKIKIKDWYNSSAPKLNTRPVNYLLQQELNWSADLDSTTNRAVFGGTWNVACVDTTGKIVWKKQLESPGVYVNISGNGKTVAVGQLKGTISWYRMRDGMLLLSFYMLPDTKNWIMYTPAGYYDCTPGAEESIGWNVNNNGPSSVYIYEIEKDMPAEKAGIQLGDTILAIENIPVSTVEEADRVFYEKLKMDTCRITLKRSDKIFDVFLKPHRDEKTNELWGGMSYTIHYQWIRKSNFYPADRFFETYYRPDLIREIFKNYETDQEILKRWGDEARSVLDMKQPPEIKIISPRNGTVSSSENTTVTVKVTDQGGGIDEVLLFQNGKVIQTTQRGFKRLNEFGTERVITYNLTLSGGENKISARAFSAERVESNPDEINIRYSGAEKSVNLYLFVAGVNTYKNQRFNLNYAKPDAEGIKSRLTAEGPQIFRNVVVYELYDDQVTKKNIEQIIDEIAGKSEQKDLFIFFFAGHGTMSEPGMNSPGAYYLVPFDVTRMYGENSLLREMAVSANDLRDWCRKIKAQKQLLMLDACQSGEALPVFAYRGAAEDKAIMQLARSAGIAVLASTGTDQMAAEIPQLGHGVFTYAIMEGLNGNADGGSRDKKITVKELEAYINDLIPELTKKFGSEAQYPNSYTSGMDFPIIIVK